MNNNFSGVCFFKRQIPFYLSDTLSFHCYNLHLLFLSPPFLQPFIAMFQKLLCKQVTSRNLIKNNTNSA